MWKFHVIYDSQPRSVIVTLGGHIYRIPEVILNIFPHKQCCKVVSHTTKFNFFTICSKGGHKDTAITIASPWAPSIQQKQVDKVATKRKDSFYTQAYHVSRLAKKVQPFHPHVCDNLQQAKQHNFSNKANNSLRCRFNKCFFLFPGHSTQWWPLLPKKGGLI